MNKQKLKTKISGKLQQVRIIPKRSIYIIEIVYKKEINIIYNLVRNKHCLPCINHLIYIRAL